MAEAITMPQLGESVTEGTITKWLVRPGDKVNKYDPLADVVTDKVNAEIPSSYTGTITELVVQEDETVQVGDLICYIEVEEKSASLPARQEEVPEKTEETPIVDSMKKRYSPAVLRLAQEHAIDLEQVNGSGRGGRITRKDLEQVIQKGGTASEPARASQLETQRIPAEAAPSKQATVTEARGEKVPVKGVRKATAANMVKSKEEIPHAWTMVEADVTDLVNYRNSIKQQFKEREGFPITILSFVIKAVAEALKEFPDVNAVWGGDHILRKKDVHISIAVAAEDGLYVPVIRNVDEKSIKGIAKVISELAQRGRTGRLTIEDMQGGTFTVNNTGSFGSVQSVPIINHPQAAIMSFESIVKKPVVMKGDMIAIRSMVNLCLSLDHRMLDGLTVGRFLARIKEKLENVDHFRDKVY
nr:dihydrolipoamide acetyltransferase family protein [Bacillus piscicola]